MVHSDVVSRDENQPARLKLVLAGDFQGGTAHWVIRTLGKHSNADDAIFNIDRLHFDSIAQEGRRGMAWTVGALQHRCQIDECATPTSYY